MKFEVTAKFASDLRRLKPEHLAEFKKVLREKFVPACDGFALDPTTPWPASLRVKSMRAAPGIFEMTWSLRRPMDERRSRSSPSTGRRASGGGGSVTTACSGSRNLCVAFEGRLHEVPAAMSRRPVVKMT